MKGIVNFASVLFLLMVITSSALVDADTGDHVGQVERHGFFSRLFSFGSDQAEEQPRPRAEPTPKRVQQTEPIGGRSGQLIGSGNQAHARPMGDSAMALAKAPPASSFADPVDPYEVLKRADESRGNLQGIAWRVEVESNERGRKDSMLYDIKARGFNISGTNMAPPKSKGQKLLMIDNNMWFHKPGLSKPIPISLRQKLMGQASYGDVASTNYAEDYEATRLADETVDGAPCYVFDLKARNSHTTYDRIRYWVDKQRLVGVKADYFTLSGKRFKSASMNYGSTVMINGEARPFISQIAIYEELMSGDVTTLSMTRPQLTPLPDYIFNLNLFMK